MQQQQRAAQGADARVLQPGHGLLYTPVIDLRGVYKLKTTPFEEGMAY